MEEPRRRRSSIQVGLAAAGSAITTTLATLNEDALAAHDADDEHNSMSDSDPHASAHRGTAFSNDGDDSLAERSTGSNIPVRSTMRRKRFSTVGGDPRLGGALPHLPVYELPTPVLGDSAPSAIVNFVARSIYRLLWCLLVLLTFAVSAELARILNLLACLMHCLLVPYQLAFDTPVEYSTLYTVGYLLDAVALWSRLVIIYKAQGGRMLLGYLSRAVSTAVRACSLRTATARVEDLAGRDLAGEEPHLADGAKAARRSRVDLRAQRARPTHRLQERVSWTHGFRDLASILLCLPVDACLWSTTAQWTIPYLRTTRLVFSPLYVHESVALLERSQVVAFSVSRIIRVMGFFLL